MIAKAFIFICGLAAGVLAYDSALEMLQTQYLPDADCTWLSAPVRYLPDFAACKVRR